MNSSVDGNATTDDTVGHRRISHNTLIKADTDISMEGDNVHREHLSLRSRSPQRCNPLYSKQCAPADGPK